MMTGMPEQQMQSTGSSVREGKTNSQKKRKSNQDDDLAFTPINLLEVGELSMDAKDRGKVEKVKSAERFDDRQFINNGCTDRRLHSQVIKYSEDNKHESVEQKQLSRIASLSGITSQNNNQPLLPELNNCHSIYMKLANLSDADIVRVESREEQDVGCCREDADTPEKTLNNICSIDAKLEERSSISYMAVASPSKKPIQIEQHHPSEKKKSNTVKFIETETYLKMSNLSLFGKNDESPVKSRCGNSQSSNDIAGNEKKQGKFMSDIGNKWIYRAIEKQKKEIVGDNGGGIQSISSIEPKTINQYSEKNLPISVNQFPSAVLLKVDNNVGNCSTICQIEKHELQQFQQQSQSVYAMKPNRSSSNFTQYTDKNKDVGVGGNDSIGIKSKKDMYVFKYINRKTYNTSNFPIGGAQAAVGQIANSITHSKNSSNTGSMNVHNKSSSNIIKIDNTRNSTNYNSICSNKVEESDLSGSNNRYSVHVYRNYHNHNRSNFDDRNLKANIGNQQAKYHERNNGWNGGINDRYHGRDNNANNVNISNTNNIGHVSNINVNNISHTNNINNININIKIGGEIHNGQQHQKQIHEAKMLNVSSNERQKQMKIVGIRELLAASNYNNDNVNVNANNIGEQCEENKFKRKLMLTISNGPRSLSQINNAINQLDNFTLHHPQNIGVDGRKISTIPVVKSHNEAMKSRQRCSRGSSVNNVEGQASGKNDDKKDDGKNGRADGGNKCKEWICCQMENLLISRNNVNKGEQNSVISKTSIKPKQAVIPPQINLQKQAKKCGFAQNSDLPTSKHHPLQAKHLMSTPIREPINSKHQSLEKTNNGTYFVGKKLLFE